MLSDKAGYQSEVEDCWHCYDCTETSLFCRTLEFEIALDRKLDQLSLFAFPFSASPPTLTQSSHSFVFQSLPFLRIGRWSCYLTLW
jgi:hypothetical protein